MTIRTFSSSGFSYKIPPTRKIQFTIFSKTFITDPCYIINKDNDERFGKNGELNFPCWWNFVTKTTTTECPDSHGGTFTRYNMPKPEDYPDCREKVDADYRDNLERMIDARKKTKPMFSPTLQAEWDAYHKAEEEWESVPHDDWSRCGCGENMSVLGLKNYLTGDTLYGDWSCTVFNSDTKKNIGEFCADSAMVGVFLLNEVLAYNPKFNYHIERTWTTALIKDFHGTVELHMEDDTVTVIGKGNINFISTQTGL